MIAVSIGSCLSRRVAANIAGLRVINSVYHNRSDALLDVLLTNGGSLKSLSVLSETFRVVNNVEGEFSAFSILANQSHEFFGLHDIPHGAPLIKALQSTKIDLILVDNFIDLVGRLYATNIGNYFCKAVGFCAPRELKLGARLTPQQSAHNFRFIVDLLLTYQPHAKVAFLQFPINNYESEDRRLWGWNFRDALVLPDSVMNVHVRKVMPKYEGREPHHFASREYRKYAAEVSTFFSL